MVLKANQKVDNTPTTRKRPDAFQHWHNKNSHELSHEFAKSEGLIDHRGNYYEEDVNHEKYLGFAKKKYEESLKTNLINIKNEKTKPEVQETKELPQKEAPKKVSDNQVERPKDKASALAEEA